MVKVEEKTPLKPRKIISVVMGIANKIMNELSFKERINAQVEWDKDHWGMSPGSLAKGLVLSTLTDMRTPLTHINERLRPYDLRYLIGDEADYHDINSFNVGRALERIGEADYNGIYEGLALTALHKYDIPVGRLHSDTTTVSFYGEYDYENMALTEEEQKTVVEIEKGYNKDGRPGCKQALVGQVVTEQGIPLTTRVLDGATSDVEWNKMSLDYLEELRKSGFTHGTYVADSKLVTEDLVKKMNAAETKVSFVSRCPSSFAEKLESRMIKRAYETDGWEDIGQVGAGKKASSYRGKSFIEPVCDIPMRLLVLESSAMAAKAEQALEKERAKIDPLIKELEKKEFACHADAEKEYNRFMGRKELKLFNCSAEIREYRKEKWPRGRRKAETRPAIIHTFRIHIIQVEQKERACCEYIRKESCFAIISNVTDETVTSRELLETYKGQHVVENSFRQLKGPNLASVIYLKNPIRIQGLTMLLSFSLLIRAIIQYRLRDGLAKHEQDNPGQPIYAGWGGRPLTKPTFKLLYEHSINCYYEREGPGEYSFIWPYSEAKYIIGSLLKLMGLTISSILEPV